MSEQSKKKRVTKRDRERIARLLADKKRELADYEEIQRLVDRIKEIRDIVHGIAINSKNGDIYHQIKDYIPEFVNIVRRVQGLAHNIPELRPVVDKAIKEDSVTTALLEIAKLKTDITAEVMRTDKIITRQVVRQLTEPKPMEGSICIWVGCEHPATVFTNENNVGYCKTHARTAGIIEPGKA